MGVKLDVVAGPVDALAEFSNFFFTIFMVHVYVDKKCCLRAILITEIHDSLYAEAPRR